MIDTTKPNTPGWWLKRLLKKLDDERHRYDKLDTYYRGENGIPITATKACRDAYLRLMALARTNYSELVVEAVRERMTPTGFRTGADGDDLGDKEAWRIWQANCLDADCDLVHRAELSMADAYVIVGAVDEDRGAALITPEDPREVVTERDPIDRRRARAALKFFTDDADGTDWAYIYLPGVVYKAARTAKKRTRATTSMTGWEWTNVSEDTETGLWMGERLPPQLNGRLPVVRFANKADMFGRSMGEFEPHLSILDRINFGVLNRLEIVTLQAFRQRAVKGLADKDAEGNEIDYDDVFSADPGALWQLPETAEMWESGQVDIGPLNQVDKSDVMALAAVTRTPLFYLTPDATNGSAEGASLAREGLVFKTGDRIKQTTESWEQVMSLAFLMAGDETRGRRGDMECLWAPPERYSLSERADAASKATDVPWRTRMTDIWQFTPQQVDRMTAERVMDSFLQMTDQPPTEVADDDPAPTGR